MSEEIPYLKRYIYNLDDTILHSLHTLYFDSVTFEQKTYQEFLTRRGDEIEEPKTTAAERTVPLQPIIVQPKARNIDKLAATLSNLKISKSENAVQHVSDESGSDARSSSESEDEQDDDFFQEKPLQPIEENEDEYESTISFMTTRSPMVLFKSDLLPAGTCFGVYKSSINAADSPNFDPLATLENLTFSSSKPMPKDPIAAGMSAIFMLSSGHFAGAIVSHLPHSTKGNKGTPAELQLQSVRLLAHKTFHRYTTRRKQGGSQSAMDDSKGKANSAGSTLRRYNEQALGKDIEMLMDEWKPLLDQCSSIFLRGSGKGGKNARGTGLIVRDPKDPKAVIKTGDKRIKMIPFATKRPTTVELKKAWCELAYLKVVDLPKVEKSEIDKRRKRDELISKSRTVKKGDGDEQDLGKLTNELITILKKSKAPALIAFMRKNKDQVGVDFRLQPEEQYTNTPTLLHYASKKGLAFMAQTLLVQLHADPTIESSMGKTAYEVAPDDETRHAFQVSRGILGDEGGVSWDQAHVGPALTKQEAQDLKLRMKQEKEALVEQENKELKQAHESVVGEFRNKESSRQPRGVSIGGPGLQRVTEEQKLSGLSELQKQKLLREQRFRAIEARLKRQ